MVDISRTDYRYWERILENENLGMNRGTTIPDVDKLFSEIDKEPDEPTDKGGRPKKRGPKGPHSIFNHKEIQKQSRFTIKKFDGVFQVGGFTNYGAKPHATSGRRIDPEAPRDFITYVGDSQDLARIEESNSLRASGQVLLSGYGPDN